MNIRNKEWYKHAEGCLTRIKEFRQQSPLGYYNSPEEYMDTVEDFIKLFYNINEVPTDVTDLFSKSKKAFDVFKNDISDLCEILLKEAKKSSDENL